MNTSGFWDVLGIEPTSDVLAVRRAYARQLRGLRPDAHPAGFQQLRMAYEAALVWTAHTIALSGEARDIEQDACLAKDAELEHTLDVQGLVDQLLPLLKPLAADPDVVAATVENLLCTLDLLQCNEFSHRLAVAVAAEERLSALAVVAVAAKLGWDDVTHLSRQGGIFVNPAFQSRLHWAFSQVSPDVIPHAPLGIRGLIIVAGVFVGFLWVVARLIRYFTNDVNHRSPFDSALSDWRLLQLWWVISAVLVAQFPYRWIITRLRWYWATRQARRKRRDED